jgi:hypothetical protein
MVYDPHPCARQEHSTIPHDAASLLANGLVRTPSLVFLYNLFITIVLANILRKDSHSENE